MKVQDVKEIAQKMDIPAGKLKKTELIRAIQAKEGNQACFDTGQAKKCGQQNCCWMEDCK